MHSERVASYPCRIERGTPTWAVSFRDVPQAVAGGRGVPDIFEVAESALVEALDALGADAARGLPAASSAPGEVVITVRLGGPPLVRSPPPSEVVAISGEVVDPSETGLVGQGFWGSAPPSPPAGPSEIEDEPDEDVPVVWARSSTSTRYGRTASSETGLVPVRRQGLWSRLRGLADRGPLGLGLRLDT